MKAAKALPAIALCAALGLGPAGQSLACAFHGYTPDPTLVDFLLNTEQVAIARLSRTDPGRYVMVEALLGPEVSEIPIAVAPSKRRALQADPQAFVLLARDGAYGPWMEKVVLDARYRRIVAEVMAQQSAWQLGRDRDRLPMFARLVNDPNPDIRYLALRELDRVPYADLRRQRVPPVQGLRHAMLNGSDELKPIRVLLAGLSGDRSHSQFLSDELHRAVQRDVPHLGAYATALIELEGRAAIDGIINGYLKGADLPMTTNERLLDALALQYRSGTSTNRRAVTRAVADLIRTRPDLAEVAARQFNFEGERRLAD